VVGITLSVATLIVVMSVMNGFRIELVKKITGINAHITLHGMEGAKITNWRKKIQKISQTSGIDVVMGVVEGQGMLVNKKNNASSGILIKGLSGEDIKLKASSFKVYGQVDTLSNDTIVLGLDIALKIGARIGTQVTLVGADMSETIFGFVPRHKTYRVIGIVETGMPYYDSIVGFVSLSAAQVFYRYGDSVNTIEITLHDMNDVDHIGTSVRKMEESKDLMIRNWQEENDGLMHALKIERNVMFFILSLFVAVAMFAILANLIMLVYDKSRSIAILRSMGVSSHNIALIFFITGTIIAISGILLGVTFGVSFASNIDKIKSILENFFHTKLFDGAVYFLSNLPSILRTQDILLVAGLAFFFATIASIVPAIKASKKHPADALKYL